MIEIDATLWRHTGKEYKRLPWRGPMIPALLCAPAPASVSFTMPLDVTDPRLYGPPPVARFRLTVLEAIRDSLPSFPDSYLEKFAFDQYRLGRRRFHYAEIFDAKVSPLLDDPFLYPEPRPIICMICGTSYVRANGNCCSLCFDAARWHLGDPGSGAILLIPHG